MNIKLLEADAMKQRVNEHLNMPPDEDIWDDKNAVEAIPLLLWNFDPIFNEMNQDVLQI